MEGVSTDFPRISLFACEELADNSAFVTGQSAVGRAMSVLNRTLEQWFASFPLLEDVVAYREVLWQPDSLAPASEMLSRLPFGLSAMEDAANRLERFRPLVAELFPETAMAGGLIESEIRKIPHMGQAIGYDGRLLIKLDSDLPIAGSVKARGGIYEILKLAERVACSELGFGFDADYRLLATPAYRQVFSEREVVVGSTGNLGLSIGMTSARLGFRVTVHMSADAKQWKKDLLRANGVSVVEYREDYSKAVEEGRKQALANPKAHFVDDENSMDLFMGYSVAALRLHSQLESMKLLPSIAEPLDVYLPCGVGGAPGGITFGLKHVFGDAVRCWLVEPTHSPCMLIGLMTGEHDRVSVQDFGLDNRTAADGLAVGRASKFAGKMIEKLVSGVMTVSDERLNPWTRQLYETENLFIEPSAAASFIGPLKRSDAKFALVWATGGRLVPKDIRDGVLKAS